ARTWENRAFAGFDSDLTIGFQTRHDFIDGAGLWRTTQRTRHTTVRQDDIWEGSAGLHGEAVTRWTPWFRTVVGLRGDLFWFNTRTSTLAANEGYDWAGIVSPKFSAIFGPWHETELYFNFGTGFHSNDARGVNTRIDPNTGLGVETVDPLVRTMGAEIGLRTQAIPDVTSTLSFFWLQSDSELVYVGDAGTNEPGPASRRLGVELATYWRPNTWFSTDAELALTYARFRNSPGTDHIPNSVPVMFSGGVNFGAQGDAPGWFVGVRARIFANRPLEETNTFTGRDSVMINGTVGYRRKNWEAAVDCLNILNRADNDIEYYYESQLPGEAAPVADVHLHPVEPRMFRFRVTYRF
ncbi:MAG TPA: TonB-dependent receptor, partial [Prosthecobacter sp.]|nr:TonB-dependent receptor [Prosthecobacter sp.]